MGYTKTNIVNFDFNFTCSMPPNVFVYSSGPSYTFHRQNHLDWSQSSQIKEYPITPSTLRGNPPVHNFTFLYSDLHFFPPTRTLLSFSSNSPSALVSFLASSSRSCSSLSSANVFIFFSSRFVRSNSSSVSCRRFSSFWFLSEWTENKYSIHYKLHYIY